LVTGGKALDGEKTVGSVFIDFTGEFVDPTFLRSDTGAYGWGIFNLGRVKFLEALTELFPDQLAHL
jgi:hypothetical protein